MSPYLQASRECTYTDHILFILVYFNICLMKIEEKMLHMANRDANMMTNIKKDILEKKELPRKVRDSS